MHVANPEFGDPSLDLLNEEKREKVIALIKSGFTEGRQRNRPPPNDEAVPEFLKHTKMFLPVFKATDSQTRHFGFPKHNNWEQFITTVRSAKSELASCKVQVKKRCCERKKAEDEYGVARDRRYTRALNSNTTLA